jgi:hypothetical protein
MATEHRRAYLRENSIGHQIIVAQPSHTQNGYDPAWLVPINNVLEDRGTGTVITDITDELWEKFIGPMVDAIEDGNVEVPRRCK